MKVLVVGATGGSGRGAVQELLEAGHRVTAFARHPDSIGIASDRLTAFAGDATKREDVSRAVRGHDAVVVTLGIRENALRVRFFGSARTPLDVRSVGTRNVVAAMHEHGVKRLVVQTTFGAGETRGKLSLGWGLVFWLVLKPQVEDTERQERVVRESGLEWVLAQPVGLTDDPEPGEPYVSPDGEVRGMSVSRRKVGRFLAHAVEGSAYVGRSIALSA